MSDVSHTIHKPYQSFWVEKFEEEKIMLKEIFGDKTIAIEHIGSTSIPGLLSKPIVDIAVMIENPEDADSFTEPLVNLGYRFHSSSTERYFYTKGTPIEYHVSIAYADRGGFWPRQILFRDYLRTNPEARDEYARLKERLLQKDPTGKGEYLSGKTEFVQKILERAGWKEGQTYRTMLPLQKRV
ncbi:GrpB family protein [Candidatus Azambacteria bacterium]|nr:GrpB family protein [Candidatus Azambacteria bacterium]